MRGSTDKQELLAHSPRVGDTPGDPYARHVSAVRQGARERAEAMLKYASHPPPGILEAIDVAAVFHDLGKVDAEIQAALAKGRSSKLRWDHVDAGVAHLTANNDWLAGWLVRGHHPPGLPERAEHFVDDGRRLRGRRRDHETAYRHEEQIARTDALLERYLRQHETAVGCHAVKGRRAVHGLPMRLALSCLVDADHSDSAFADSGSVPPQETEPRWAERLNALCNYVRDLPIGKTQAEQARNKRRQSFFEACLGSPITDTLVSCEAPVGLGKTTAVTAYLVRRAHEEHLRRLIIVAPFTNILKQTASRLRKALVLPGEATEQVIVEHHHRADFSRQDDRELAVLWRAPIVLTTSVSLFETLAACDPATLRKLHALPGSAIFLDEAHAALPTKLWPQNWKWLRELADDWGCRFVFASGSLSRFWETPEIVDRSVRLKELLPGEQAAEIVRSEKHRVTFVRADSGRVLNIEQLVGLVQSQAGPRLVILNTVQNAAVIADTMRKSGLDVLHLSTALTPNDRKGILEAVQQRLQTGRCSDWTLVATSCVEAGLDLSFRSAFRERFTTASTIQTGGRVNRNGEYDESGGATVYDFALADRGITQHPAARVACGVLNDFMIRDSLNTGNPADVVTRAMIEELKRCGGLPSDPLIKAEVEQNYPAVKELGRVIDAPSYFVAVDPELQKLLVRREPVTFRMLLQGSVQLWATRIEKLGLQPMTVSSRSSEIYLWSYDYDPDFLGYMKGVLKLEDFIAAGGAVI